MRSFHDIQQNTDEWSALRLGKFTGSVAGDLFMGKSTAGYQKAIYSPVYERMFGEKPEGFRGKWMDRGHEVEPFAAQQYETETFNQTTNGGFWQVGEWFGASPDRMVEKDGMLEIKCPAYNTMIDYLIDGKLPKIYKWQVVSHMYAADRDWCDFMAFEPRLTPLVLRVHRDEKTEAELVAKLAESVEKAQALMVKLEGSRL
jgi:putative phage-type endonuclease